MTTQKPRIQNLLNAPISYYDQIGITKHARYLHGCRITILEGPEFYEPEQFNFRASGCAENAKDRGDGRQSQGLSKGGLESRGWQICMFWCGVFNWCWEI
uniref:Uncharacterized protein n=1 Tax=Spironucleus salmonicida TaxID=348837 RepID=V6LGM7_9EUKA|eukprot:EST42856.1 Hypothetical protein SS50377_17478 [Spironucleus salmonicida]